MTDPLEIQSVGFVFLIIKQPLGQGGWRVGRTPVPAAGPSRSPRGCGSRQRCQAAPLSSASSYYGNRDTFSWTEVRAALCSRHSPVQANLGNDFSASSCMTHLYRPPIRSAGYQESHSNHLCQQLLRRPGTFGVAVVGFLKPI